MDWNLILKVVVALAPVAVALVLFDRFDLFDLVSFRTLFVYVLVGAAVATVAYYVNGTVLNGVVLADLPIGENNYSRFVAPVVEESLKAIVLGALFAANRIGFKLDAAIIGFAIGAGFSILENIFYLEVYSTHIGMGVWIVRGLGTAIMHGGSAAMFAVITHEFMERQSGQPPAAFRFNPLLFIPGLLVAILIHGAFNQFGKAPIIAMMGALLLVPATIFLVFAKSEKATHSWLAADFETHQKALADIRSGAFAASDAGKRLARLAKGFRKASATDIFDYVALKTELVLRAEEILLDREDGDRPAVGKPELDAFARLKDLEKRIGSAVLRAIRPYLAFSRNDLWELRKLEELAREHR